MDFAALQTPNHRCLHDPQINVLFPLADPMSYITPDCHKYMHCVGTRLIDLSQQCTPVWEMIRPTSRVGESELTRRVQVHAELQDRNIGGLRSELCGAKSPVGS